VPTWALVSGVEITDPVWDVAPPAAAGESAVAMT
jgi:hypothetical protein